VLGRNTYRIAQFSLFAR